MRILALIWTSILISFLELNGQEYFTFPTENVNWNVLLIASCDDNTPPDTTILRYTLHGDTAINEVVYNKLCLESGDTINPRIESVGGIREEGKKIYYFGAGYEGFALNEEDEVLLYDFTKQIGDTIIHDSIFSNYIYTVIEDIDSIMIDGDYRKRYQVDNHWHWHYPDYIVEGIGSILNGLLGHITEIPTCGYHYWEHICFKEGGKIKYLNPSFNDCFPSYLYTSTSQINLESNIRLYPNPTNNVLIIENSSFENELIVRIIDTEGKVISQMQIDNIKTSIGLPNTSGIYSLLITNNNGQILKIERIIKQ